MPILKISPITVIPIIIVCAIESVVFGFVTDSLCMILVGLLCPPKFGILVKILEGFV